jgi:hypothetical protein
VAVGRPTNQSKIPVQKSEYCCTFQGIAINMISDEEMKELKTSTATWIIEDGQQKAVIREKVLKYTQEGVLGERKLS